MQPTVAGRLSIAFCFVVLASAQEITGDIRGSVADPSGASIRGATVRIVNTDRNVLMRELKTGQDGSYTATYLPVGQYAISVSAPGFERFQASDIVLNVSDHLVLDVKMQIGATESTVEVRGDSLPIDLETPQAAGLMTGTQIRELAVNSRNFVQLVALQPGVTTDLASDNLYAGASNPTGFSNQINISINGGRPTQNNWTIDGADNVDREANLTLLNYPSIDSIAEFKVLRSNYLPEHGRSSAGEVTVITRSGTNQLHGSLYEFFRNDVLDGNNWFLNRGAVPRPPLRWNDWGFTAGGPIRKNRTFFFYSQEWRHIVYYPNSLTAQLPTAAELSGNFPVPVCVSFDAHGNCAAQSKTLANIDATAGTYVKDIFSKLAVGTSGGQLAFADKGQAYYREETIRIDHNFARGLSLFGRYSDDAIPTREPLGLYTSETAPGVATTSSNAPGRNLSAHATWTASSHILNDFGYAFSWGAVLSDPVGTLARNNSPDIQPNLVFPSTAGTVPFVDLCALTNVACGQSLYGFGSYRDYNRNHNFFDNLSMVRKHHSLKFGASYNYYTKDQNHNNYATYYFDDAAPMAAADSTFEQLWANFLQGRVAEYTQTSTEFRALVHQHQFEFYGQDEWRLRPGFTVDYGLRYSLFLAPTYGNGQLSTFDPKLYQAAAAPPIDSAGLFTSPLPQPYTNGMIVGGKNSPFGQAVQRTPHLAFAPRVGFAWDPARNGRNAIRGGYGIFFDSPAVNSVENFQSSNPPVVTAVTIFQTSLGNPGHVAASPNTSPPTVGGPDPNQWTLPYTHQYNLDFQHVFTARTMLDIGYYGTLGRHLIGVIDVNMPRPGAFLSACLGGPNGTSCNQPFAFYNYQLLNQVRPYRGFDAINLFEPKFESNYNSLQVRFQKQLNADSIVTVNYTWSHALGTASGDYRSAQSSYDLQGDYGNLDFDRRHVFSATYVYALPFFKAQHGVQGHLFGGWELSGLLYLSTGRHYTASSLDDPAGLGTYGATYSASRPDLVGDPQAGAPKTVDRWFNTAAFAPVPSGQIRPGDERRGTIVGPGYQRWDTSVFKNARLTERLNAQFRVEAFNVLNHANFGIGSPGSAFQSLRLGSALFGRIGNAYEARQMQLALKLRF
jgi:hypothetical protein